jgi:hypothetical protein
VLTVETATNGVEQRLRAGALCVPVVLGCADGMGTRPGPRWSAAPQVRYGSPRGARAARARGVTHVLLPVRAPGGDGAGMVAPLRWARRSGPDGVYAVVSRVVAGPGAARRPGRCGRTRSP